MFRGVQSGSVDDKFRLKLPSVVRGALLKKYKSSDCFVTSLDGREVRIYPNAEWESAERKLSAPAESGDPHDGTKRKKILLRANHFGADGSLDNQGRILIPGSLREDSGVRGEVFLQWSRNHILVLGAELYQQRLAQAELDHDDLALADNLGV